MTIILKAQKLIQTFVSRTMWTHDLLQLNVEDQDCFPFFLFLNVEYLFVIFFFLMLLILKIEQTDTGVKFLTAKSIQQK